MTTEPFVGRQAELQRLCEAFDGAREGRGGVVMITGDPGIGKTRLARELESYAAEHGARVLWGSAPGGDRPAYPDGLSEREVEVLRLVAAGKTNADVADELVISINTVARHMTNIFNKTGAANRAEAAVFAVEHDLSQ